MKTTLSIISIVFVLLVSCGPSDVNEARKQYEEFKKDSINKIISNEEKWKHRYKFEYFQDPTTGICYSIYKSYFHAHQYGDVTIISHTCVPCEEAGFKSFKKDLIK